MSRPKERWDPGEYDSTHHYVTDYGRSLVDLLAAQPGERILDLGCGTGHLTQQIAERGATVVCADVYERTPAIPSAAALAAMHVRFAAGEMHVITATSVEVGRNLLMMAAPELRGEFQRVHWLVPSDRVALSLRDMGLQAPLLRAASAEDQDLVTALIRWRSSVSGA